jgi:Holliday junction resolvasome RuvABC endonuclease subunit|tara:strand:- start:94 stop:624 length:531 start_codon:yes stop_codon:yes gene_type:complete
MILGLDVSTSITGVSVVDHNGELLLYEAWDMRNKRYFPTLWSKADFIENKLRELKVRKKFIIEKVFVEQNLQAFRPGLSSAKTILTLAKFNGIVSYLARRMYELEPEYIAAPTARKLCGIKVERGKKAKDMVLEHILKTEPSFKIQYTKHGNPKPGSHDMSDAIIIAKAGVIFHKK